MQNSTTFLALLLLVVFAAASTAAENADEKAADKHVTFKVWEGTPPGEKEALAPHVRSGGRVRKVTQPDVTVYLPPKGKANGTAVLVCPGGGYGILAEDHEGIQVAKWLNENGVTAFLLRYRVPCRPGLPKHLAALQDAQRALSLIRSKAGAFGIKEDKIGILGFSAGGHLTLMTSTCFKKRAYPAKDEVDKISCRPDFAIPVYPAYIVDKESGELVDEVQITQETPPMFFAHAGDDVWSAAGSALLYAKLRQLKSPSELHVWAKGGHGFGMNKRGEPSDQWPQHAAAWMKRIGIIEGGK